jgi:hypothetical protein
VGVLLSDGMMVCGIAITGGAAAGALVGIGVCEELAPKDVG